MRRSRGREFVVHSPQREREGRRARIPDLRSYLVAWEPDEYDGGARWGYASEAHRFRRIEEAIGIALLASEHEGVGPCQVLDADILQPVER